MGKIFKRGLIALAPVAISLAIVIWLLDTLESIFRVPLEWLVGEHYFPGMGLVVAIVFIFCFGIIVNNFLIQKMTGLMDRIFARIPLFKTIYNSIGDMMSYFQPKDQKKTGKMVIIEHDGMSFLGIITREEFSDLPEGFAGEGEIAVYVPLSYQIGGLTLTLPRSKVKPLDMTIEHGMRYIVTAGMISGKNNQKNEPKSPKNSSPASH